MPIWEGTFPLAIHQLPWGEHWPAQATAQVLAEAQGLIAPRAVYEIVPVVERLPAGVGLPGGIVLRCPSLRPAGRLGLAVCTIGPALEARCQEWSAQGELGHAFLLDALGVVALQESGHRLERHIAAEVAAQGMCLGRPRFPGQDDWPLEDQQALFAILQPARIGVRLNESNLMVPLKSASMAFPVGLPGELPTETSACARCERRSACPYAQ